MRRIALRAQPTMVLLEQRVDQALSFAETLIVLERSTIGLRGPSAEFARDEVAEQC